MELFEVLASTQLRDWSHSGFFLARNECTCLSILQFLEFPAEPVASAVALLKTDLSTHSSDWMASIKQRWASLSLSSDDNRMSSESNIGNGAGVG
jgi:hypothetical protein